MDLFQQKNRRLYLLSICVAVLMAAILANPARREPSTPVQLTEQDQSEILKVLQVERAAVRSMEACRILSQPSRILASVAVRASLPPRDIEGVDVILCIKPNSRSRWTCSQERPRNMIYASLPQGCFQGSIPGQKSRDVSLVNDKSLSEPQIRALLDLICTSPEMHQQAWSKGHQVSWIRRNEEGYLEIGSESQSGQSGLRFVLEQSCSGQRCRFSIRETGGWIT